MHPTTRFVLGASIVALASAASAQSSSAYRVTASSLNVRSGPSTSNAKVASLQRGAVVSVESIQSGWAAIKINGVVRYVSASYLEKVAAPAPTPTGSAIYETTTGLNLRAGPSTNDQVVTTMPQGARVTALGESSGWLRVRYGTTTGYAYGDYLRPVAGSTPPPTPTPRPTTPAPTRTVAHVANYRVKTPYSVARSAPSRSSAEVTTLRRGDRFRSTRSALSGYYIGFTFQGRTAWVIKTSLEREDGANTLDVKTGKATSPQLFRLTLNQDLRAGPTGRKKDVKLGRVLRGQLVTGQRHYDPSFFLFRSWRLISVDGRRGWVQARYLSAYKPAEVPKPPTIDTTSGRSASGVYAVSRTTLLRTKPGSGERTETVRSSTRVTVRREARYRSRDYVLVSRAGKTRGWMLRSRLRTP